MCFILLDTFSGLWVTMMATLQWPTGCQQKWRGKPGEMRINWRFKRQKSERNGTYHAKRSSAKIGGHPGAPYCNCSDHIYSTVCFPKWTHDKNKQMRDPKTSTEMNQHCCHILYYLVNFNWSSIYASNDILHVHIYRIYMYSIYIYIIIVIFA